MKNRLELLLLALIFAIPPSTTLGQIEPHFKTLTTISLKDDVKNPVTDASVTLLFNHIIEQKSTIRNGFTDISGKFSAEEKIISSLTITASKDKHYPIRLDPALTRIDVDSRTIKNFDVPLVIREVLNPHPLYARKVSRAIPPGQLPIGFDLKVGDWVEPRGRGKISDLTAKITARFLRYHDDAKPAEMIRRLTSRHTGNPLAKHEYFQRLNQFHENNIKYTYPDAIMHSFGVWDGELIITFTEPQEGAATVDRDYHVYSNLRMPHLAYESGYKTLIATKKETFSPEPTNKNIGYFLRTRVQEDEDGEIVSANYAKIIEDISFDPRGRIEFAYVFNPTPNDRNLEFDPDRNLFGNLPVEQQVRTP